MTERCFSRNLRKHVFICLFMRHNFFFSTIFLFYSKTRWREESCNARSPRSRRFDSGANPDLLLVGDYSNMKMFRQA